MIKVCIVIPVRFADENLLSITKRFINSIKEKTIYPDYEILVFDNNSKSELSQAFLEYSNQVNMNMRVMNQGKTRFNLSKVYNQSLDISDAEIFIFATNDLEVLNEGWLTNIVKWFKSEPNLGICAPYTDFLSDPVGRSVEDRLVDHGDVSMAIYVVQREKMEKIGKFDERFDLYYHDHNVHHQFKSKGYDVKFAYNVLIKHYGERTTIHHPEVSKEEQEQYPDRYGKAYNLLHKKWNTDSPSIQLANGKWT